MKTLHSLRLGIFVIQVAAHKRKGIVEIRIISKSKPNTNMPRSQSNHQ